MRENRPSGSEGGVALRRHPYPYRKRDAWDGIRSGVGNIGLRFSPGRGTTAALSAPAGGSAAAPRCV